MKSWVGPVILVALLGSSCAESSPIAPSPTATRPRISVTFQVVDQETGSPITTAVVVLPEFNVRMPLDSTGCVTVEAWPGKPLSFRIEADHYVPLAFTSVITTMTFWRIELRPL